MEKLKSLKVPEDVWRKAKIGSLEARLSLQDFVVKAIETYLKKRG